MLIRPYAQPDGVGLHGWLPDPPRNPFIIHGPDRATEDGRWSRTLVAEVAGEIVGAATLVEHRVHRQRYPCTVDVRSTVRRRGIGSELIRGLREVRPDNRALDARVRTDDERGYGFCRAVGFVPYVECPLWRLDLAPPVVDVLADHAVRSGVEWRSLADASDSTILDMWVDVYEWIHADWSPIHSRDIARTVLMEGLPAVDRAASTVAIRAGRPVALALVVESVVIAETIRRDEPDGHGLVAGAVASALRTVADRGVSAVIFDGHAVDPHLPAVLTGLPTTSNGRLLFMELS
jgi:GNAT superfamily N-acetyltransferase